MVNIQNASVQYKPENIVYKIIINANYINQTLNTIVELGEAKEDQFTYEYELSDNILVILWK